MSYRKSDNEQWERYWGDPLPGEKPDPVAEAIARNDADRIRRQVETTQNDKPKEIETF